MTKQHAHEGAEAHIHPQGPPPLPLDPNNVVHMQDPPPEVAPPPGFQLRNPNQEAIAHGQSEWFAREFVGGLVAIAEARGVNVADFLAEKCALLAMRLSQAESEVRILATQAEVLASENAGLRAQVEDCGCHDEDLPAVEITGAAAPPFEGPSSEARVKNGDS
jgi:hypothetical protein